MSIDPTIPTWLSNPSAPAWAQAIFAAFAIIGAVWVSAWQRSRSLRDAEKAKVREEKEHLRSLAAGLKEEIGAALDAATRQQSSIERALSQVKIAVEAGATIACTPIRAGSMVLTDAIIYRQAAAEVGRLPTDLIKLVVRFYTGALEMGRLADGAPTALEAYEVLRGLGPGFRTTAASVIRALDKFEACGFAADADIRLNREEVKELAAKMGYPLEEVMKRYGPRP
jgi:hypothetical protein